jgi:flavorubredoxin
MRTSLAEGIDWVGHIDWTVRDFHGYATERGSSYNAYLIRDEKIALIDSVKDRFATQLLAHISDFVEPEKISYVVCNHAEPDHSGSLPEVMKICPDAELVCNAKCRDSLAKHFDTASWKFKIVTDGDTLSLGKRTLSFMNTPMVHWPESMFTYVLEDHILFSMDAFGQHLASAYRFDYQEPLDTVMEEAKKYFANIVMLYTRPIARVLERAAEMKIEMIAPSHGVIWQKNIGDIITAYEDWVAHKNQAKVLVIYDTMWNSTEKMAIAVLRGAQEREIDARLIHVRATNITNIATEVLDSAAVAFGSPTLNQTLMPEMAAALTYLKGLRPSDKSCVVFGSYGWSKGAAKDIEIYLNDMKFNIIREPIQSQFAPTQEILEECRAAGRELADIAAKGDDG